MFSVCGYSLVDTFPFGSAELPFGPQRQLGSKASHLSRMDDGRWNVVAKDCKTN